MKILIVEDCTYSMLLIKNILNKGGYYDIVSTMSAEEAIGYLGIGKEGIKSTKTDVDLIMMDIMMGGMDGLEAVRIIKNADHLKNIPIIMVTAKNDNDNLQAAFEIGAIDYVTKPINRIELISRVKSVLKLKYEMDERMVLMRQLEQLTIVDGLTGISNRRHFDSSLNKEWRIACREKKMLSLILIDIDFFKKYNDHYGHQAGDQALIKVASTISKVTHRGGDLAARYGGEEFVLILPDINIENAMKMGEKVSNLVFAQNIPHCESTVSDRITLSLGVATVTPTVDKEMRYLIRLADQALYKAKNDGRNMVKCAEECKIQEVCEASV